MTYRIERLGHLGDGIAEGPVYARGVLPGEEVTGTRTGDRLTGIRIATPSPDRVKPPCRHAKSCGGCALQHASDDFVLGWKQEVVANALKAHGIAAEIGGIELSPPKSRRRAVLHGQRTKKGSIVGLFAHASDQLIEIPDCQVLDPQITQNLPMLHDLVRAGASRKEGIDLAVTVSEAGLDIAVSGGKALDESLFSQLAGLAGQHDLARLVWGSEVVVTARPPFQQMGPARVVPPPGAFLQATAAGEAALLREVQAITAGSARHLDLFAGCGTFSLPLTERAEVHAVEGLADLLKAAEAGWRSAGGLHRFTTETRDLFARPLEPVELDRFDAVIVDPPRAGAEAQMQAIAKSQLAIVAHVSCNPVTFARDAHILTAAGFAMGPITVVDQFRWSPHVELVAGFSR